MNCAEIMLELVRASVLNRNPEIPKETNVDWDLMMNLASKEGLIGWGWDGIMKLPQSQRPSRLHKVNWGLSAQEITDRYFLQEKVLSHMVQECAANGIKLLLLKGIGLSRLYPKPELRPSGDIDIYLFDDYERGNELFCHVDSEFRNKHTSFDYLGVHIENHQTPLDVDTKHRRFVEAYIEGQSGLARLTDGGYYVMDPMTNLVYLVMHSIRHFEPNIAIPFKNIIDIGMYLFKNSDELDPAECYKTFSQLGIDKQLELFVVMAECALGVDLSRYARGLVSLKQKEVLRKMILKGSLDNPIPQGWPFITGGYDVWNQYFSTIKIYKNIVDSEVPYYQKTYRHFFGTLVKRVFGKSEDEPIISIM